MIRSTMLTAVLVFLLFLFLFAGASAATGQEAPDAAAVAAAPAGAPRVLQPRIPLARAAVRVPSAGERLPGWDGWHDELVVKFVDDARVRARADGSLRSLSGRDLSAVAALAAARGLSFRPLIALPEAKLAALAERAAARSGRAQPDLAGLVVVEVPGGGAAALEAAGNALLALDVVEHAAVAVLGVPPPGDIDPPTPWMVWRQDYREPDPGMNVDYQWLVGPLAWGLRGDGVRLSDCEYGWNYAHEDLVDNDLHPEPGQTIAQGVFDNGWDEHGTAVLGETSATVGGWGCAGMVPNAEVHTYPEWTVQGGFRRVTAITNAIAGSSAGDVVLLEMQTGAGAPAEVDFGVWLAVRTGTDAGVVVVGAAGNGNQDLDGATYATWRSWGDSGAIIVGAGSADDDHDKLSFSSHGSRVDVQGWGEGVFTLGYGFFAEYGNDKNQRYTSSFSGTSSASPFAAAAAVAVQQLHRELYGVSMDPVALRELLVATGVPQGSGGHIGPFISMPDALAALQTPDGNDGVWTNAGHALAGAAGEAALRGSGTLLGGWGGSLDLSDAAPGAVAILFLSFGSTPVPLKGGTFVPFPIGGEAVLVTSGAGAIPIPFVWPAGVPSDTEVFFQYAIADAGAPQGVALSNALRLLTP